MGKLIRIAFLVIGCVITLYILSVVFAGSYIGGAFNSPPNKDKVEQYLQMNRDNILIITEYLINSEYSEIFIQNDHHERGVMFTGLETGDVQIDDAEVFDAIGELFKKTKSGVIDKTENTIHIQIWSNLDNGRGIAYSIDGKEPSLNFLTKSEPLSVKDWYYYEEDYNEWRIQNNKNSE